MDDAEAHVGGDVVWLVVRILAHSGEPDRTRTSARVQPERIEWGAATAFYKSSTKRPFPRTPTDSFGLTTSSRRAILNILHVNTLP